LQQDVPAAQPGTVVDIVAQGLGDLGTLAARYHHLIHADEPDLDQIADVQSEMDVRNAWTAESRVEAIISKLGLPAEAQFSELSGGQKRRVLLGQALVLEPDVLLLDEPTNHLDIESITALEALLQDFAGALIFVSHDRAFVRRLATRICDLDRGKLSSWQGGWDAYLTGKADALHAETQQNALFDKRLAQEEVWIRKGVQARRTRSAGRVTALLKMREQFSQRRNRSGEVKMAVQEAERSGKLVAELTDVTQSYGDRTLIRRLSTVVLRGDKIGIIGPNGAGKTTLLNLMLGKLEPNSGEVRLGTKLEVAYFDQLRSPLHNDEQTAVEAVGDGKEFVEIDGVRRHVISYLQDFLFMPDRARVPVRVFSGGERSRLMLAQLFCKPSNLLVLDEPTNDLDMETLDLLEERLIEYKGTVLLVSHDREFLDNVATRSLVFEGNAQVGDYVGGYADWLRQATPAISTPPKAAAAPPAAVFSTPPPATANRLNTKERRELEQMPARIEKLETEQTELAQQLAAPDLHQGSKDKALKTRQRLAAIEKELAQIFARWEELEALK
ncbi:MAG: ATP-binding cassette domain-containing protein, partial [Pseudomonadota bacterium]|nr:ATP-binding cassette domain-containing protein [Pseudomonadota bacterium]